MPSSSHTLCQIDVLRAFAKGHSNSWRTPWPHTTSRKYQMQIDMTNTRIDVIAMMEEADTHTHTRTCEWRVVISFSRQAAGHTQ